MNKAIFLQKQVFDLLNSIEIDKAPLWGKMNFLQMVEHLSYSVQIASGKILVPELLTGEQQDKAKNFMMSDKNFRPNTPNQLLPETPTPSKFATKTEAIDDLKKEMEYFFETYASQTTLKVQNAFFGKLDFNEQLHLLHKHFIHHLNQFGITDTLNS